MRSRYISVALKFIAGEYGYGPVRQSNADLCEFGRFALKLKVKTRRSYLHLVITWYIRMHHPNDCG
jgi:hypothetical protein